MNKVTLHGRLTSDPSLYQAESFTSVNFSVAINRKFKNQETGKTDADFISCQAFGRTAELIAQYYKKGSEILLSGEWRTGSYIKDGVTYYTNKCHVTEFDFLSGNNKVDRGDDTPEMNVILAGRTSQLNSRTPQPAPTPIQTSFIPEPPAPVAEEIPQAFDIDMSDEFPF